MRMWKVMAAAAVSATEAGHGTAPVPCYPAQSCASRLLPRGPRSLPVGPLAGGSAAVGLPKGSAPLGVGRPAPRPPLQQGPWPLMKEEERPEEETPEEERPEEDRPVGTLR